MDVFSKVYQMITVDELQQMSMAEYAAFRTKMLELSTPLYPFEDTYHYYRMLWVDTGEIKYLERMVGRVNE
jgi:hypothetical protein